MESVKSEEEKAKKNRMGRIVIRSLGCPTEYFEPVQVKVDVNKVWADLSDEERDMVTSNSDEFLLAVFSNADILEDENTNVRFKLSYMIIEKIYNSLYFELLDKNGKCIEQSTSVKSVHRFEIQRRIEEARREGYEKGYENGFRIGAQGL